MRYAIWNQFVAVEVEHIHHPEDAEQVGALVKLARARGKRIKAVGAGHSFNDLALTEHLLVDLSALSKVLAVNLDERTVRVQAGIPLHALVKLLERIGLALPNIGAWTEQTLAGVLSTATHGSGGRHRKSLVEAAIEIRLVDGLGEERVLRGAELGYLTLGFHGIITEVLLRCEPLFYVRQENQVCEGERAIERFPASLGEHDFVDLRWVGNLPRIIERRWNIVAKKPAARDRAVRAYEGGKMRVLNAFLSCLRADALSRAHKQRLFAGLARAYLAQGKGFASTAVWHEGLTFNSLGVAAPHEEREFALPLARSTECLSALRALMLGAPSAASLEIQVRFSPALELVLAPNHQRETVWFNLNIMAPEHSAELVEQISQAVYAFEARPHWPKVIPACTPSVSALYGADALRWEARRRRFDPHGLFLNDWYERHLAPAFAAAERADDPPEPCRLSACG